MQLLFGIAMPWLMFGLGFFLDAFCTFEFHPRNHRSRPWSKIAPIVTKDQRQQGFNKRLSGARRAHCGLY
jgi:hypothetical protein